MTIRQPFDLALSLETGQAFRWRRVGDEEIRHRDWGDPPARWHSNGGAWYSGVLGEYLVHLRQTGYRLLQEFSNQRRTGADPGAAAQAGLGPGDTRTTRGSCTPSSAASAASSGTTPGVPPTFSPSTGWDTEWPVKGRTMLDAQSAGKHQCGHPLRVIKHVIAGYCPLPI